MKNTKQTGFAHMMIVAAVAAIIAIGGVGYYVMSKDDNKSSNNSATPSSPAGTSSQSNKISDEDAAKATAKAHFALVYQKKTSEAYQVTCQEFKDLSSYETFQTTLDSGNFYTIDLSAIEYTSAEVRNDQAIISGPIGPLQPGTNLQVSLLKKNGQWCVYGYEAKQSQ